MSDSKNVTTKINITENYAPSTPSSETPPNKGKGKPFASSVLSGLSEHSSSENIASGSGSRRPPSPVNIAPRLFKVLTEASKKEKKNPNPGETVVHTELDTKLSDQSNSLPNLEFKDGGGYTFKTTVQKSLGSAEIAQEHQIKVEKYNKIKDKNPKAKAPIEPEEVIRTILSATGELHPAGGTHSGNPTIVNYADGGSYARVIIESSGNNVKQIDWVKESGSNTKRIGRHGSFGPRETFDHKPLTKPPEDCIVTNPKPPQKSDSEPPSPTTADKIVVAFYENPEKTMAQLELTGDDKMSYKEIGETIKPLDEQSINIRKPDGASTSKSTMSNTSPDAGGSSKIN